MQKHCAVVAAATVALLGRGGDDLEIAGETLFGLKLADLGGFHHAIQDLVVLPALESFLDDSKSIRKVWYGS